MKTLLKHNILAIIAILLLSFSYAQDFKFTAASSHKTIKTGDRFKIQFTGNARFSNFKAPKLTNFRVLSDPSYSENVSYRNGKYAKTISYTYLLMATKEGSFTIGPASGTYNGKTHKTNSLKIKVTKGVKINQNPNNQGVNSKVNVSDDIFIKSSVNKTSVYLGEQIVATYKIYTKFSIAGGEAIEEVKLNGFWQQLIDMGEIRWKHEIIGGHKWSVTVIKKYVLFPQRTGQLEIDPLEMDLIIQKKVSGGWPFSRYENIKYNCKSKSIKINVKPHPSPEPEGFKSAVGNLKMKVVVSSNEVRANEAINIKIKISGKGNIPLVDELDIKFPSDFETYDPKVNDNIKTTENGVSGSREYDYLVIPRHAGKFTIDPVVFSYFNPATKKYKTITSQPIELTVLKGDGSESSAVYNSANKEDIKMLGEDIRYIHTLPIVITHANTEFYNSVPFYLLLLIAPLLFILTYIFRNKIRVANSDVVGMKKKKASKIANKLLSSAKTSLAENNKNEFYENISKALYGYIGDKLNIAVSELNQTNIKEKLTAIQVSENTITDLIETIELCDMARFAPVSVSEQEVYNKAENSINKIEEEV